VIEPHDRHETCPEVTDSRATTILESE